MLTPEELSSIGKQKRDSIFSEEMVKFEKILLEEAKKGSEKVYIPAPNVKGLFYCDERQEAFASYLRDKGFRVQKDIEICGGVRQDPSWYLYIY